MIKGVLLLVGVVLLALGGESLAHIFANPQQVTMRCAEYVQERPPALWLRLTDCEADYLGAGYRETGGEIAELFFPVRPAGRPRTDPAALVIATRDPEALAIAQTTLGEGRQPDQEQFIVMMLKIVTALEASREVEGWGRAGVLNAFDVRRSLASLSSPVEPDALVLDLHARPRPAVPAIQAIAGALTLAGVLILHVRSKRAAAGPAPAPAGEQADGVDRPAPEEDAARVGRDQASEHSEDVATESVTKHAEVAAGQAPEAPEHDGTPKDVDLPGRDMEIPVDLRSFAPDEPAEHDRSAGLPAAEPEPVRRADAPKLRGLLLLRLPPSADTSELENAPPLGARETVMQGIAGVLGDIRFDESGQGTVAGPDHLLVIDIGREPLVHTAVARAEGAQAIELLKTLLVSAGWRAYSPRTATFIDPARLHAFAMPPGNGAA